jgi:hypothetical protein
MVYWTGKRTQTLQYITTCDVYMFSPLSPPLTVSLRPVSVGHSAFTESPAWIAQLDTEKGPMLRAYEFDR